ncbi:alpha/beta hydrolase [Actinomadura fibrosa]|uniref:Alpha/beta hydrolase n=1 Tax=Actinomadura fibrosa TaxID=111802 RepID=A0ABW2Y285_9ACTN|nr:alpha/beta hydrolase-fold protein [Actinomadura fibrosa]
MLDVRSMAVPAAMILSAMAGPAATTAPPWAPIPADDGARITATDQLDERTFDVTISSPSLPERSKVRVLVPKDWSRDTTRRWPVVYAYHGGRDTYVSWTRSTDIEEVSARYGVMVVMPESDDGAFTDWWNYGNGGPPKWETFHTTEVLQLMERNYRAGQDRAAMGISSGAYGAMAYAARHPGMFRYVASSSGILHLTRPGIPALTLFIQGFFTNSGDPFRVFGVPGLDEDNWKAHDPYVLAGNLKGTGLYVSSGTTGLPGPADHPEPGQEHSVQVQEVFCGTTSIDFLQRLRELNVPVTAHVYGDGWHNWETWELEMRRFWPLMMARLGVRPQ